MTKSGPNISQNAHDLARKEKVDVGQIEGTGSGGQITVTDVKKYINDQKAGDTTAPAEQPTPLTPGPTQHAPAADVPPVEPTPIAPPGGELCDGRKPIVRTNEETDTWWCPFCDHSMQETLTTCGGCGAVREGDEAVR